MKILSEKDRYNAEFLEMSIEKPFEEYLWGEELIDKKLIVYPKKAKDILDYKKNIKNITNCGLVVLDFNRSEYMRFTTARFDAENNCVYISENAFNSCWSDFKKSVDLGIRLTKERDGSCVIDDASEIIDLTNLYTDRRTAYIEGDRICYKGIEQSAEVKKLIGRRQSLLDNSKMTFYYSSNGGYIHDQDCELIKDIPLEFFEASEKAPKHSQYCPKCKRRLLVRVACSPYVKQISGCERFLKTMGFSNKKLEKAVLGDEMKFNYQSPSEFYIKCNEDSWMIDATDKDNLKLFHNNYKVVDENTRVIVSGYHNQNQDGNDFGGMIKYISGYTWEKHLEAKRRLEAEDIAPITVADMTVTEESIDKNKENMITKVLKFIKRLFGKK